MRANYANAMRIEMVFEGGKVDHPDDPGGRTNQGVTQRNFSAWLKLQGKPQRDVYDMRPEERDAIYRTNYANKIRFDDLPDGIDLIMLDGTIHSGPNQATKWIQRALGINADGALGDVTLERIKDHPDHDKLIAAVLDRRMLFLKNLKGWKTFGKGWTNRMNQLRQKGQAWATGSVGDSLVKPIQGVMGRALITNAVAAPNRAVGDLTAGGGGVGSTITGTLESVKETVAPMGGYAWADRILLTITIVLGVVAVAGIAWGMYARYRKAELEDALDLTPQAAPNNNDGVDPELLLLSDAPQNYQGAPAIKSI